MKQCLLLALACVALGCSQPTTKTTSVTPPAPSVADSETVNAETCVDIVWLLTHYDVTRLASGSSPAEGTGYPLECCAEGVLLPEEAYRCEIDWPSSDVIACETWTSYHDALAAAHPLGSRSPRVTENLATLKRWPSQQHHCVSTAAGLVSTEAMTERRTLTLTPSDLRYDDAGGVVIFTPDSGVKRAAYITYSLSMESFKRIFSSRPTTPVEVIVELQKVARKTERAAPGHPEPDGGFKNTYYTGTVVGTR
ncbi:MAG: hypothetical protein ACPGU1_10070 [Myxococcota bacterium]